MDEYLLGDYLLIQYKVSHALWDGRGAYQPRPGLVPARQGQDSVHVYLCVAHTCSEEG